MVGAKFGYIKYKYSVSITLKVDIISQKGYAKLLNWQSNKIYSKEDIHFGWDRYECGEYHTKAEERVELGTVSSQSGRLFLRLGGHR